jgi:hypothetical protein
MGTVNSVALDRFYKALRIENAGHMSRYWNEASLEKTGVGGLIPSLWSYRRLGVKSQEKSTSYKGPYNAISGGAEHFRNSRLNVEELIHRFHSGADGVLRVKMQSRVDSANWPMKAKFFTPSGTTFGRSAPLRVVRVPRNHECLCGDGSCHESQSTRCLRYRNLPQAAKRRWRDLNQ